MAAHDRLCAAPPQEMEREKEGPVQGRLYRSLKLWSFYCDLEESLGTLESTQRRLRPHPRPAHRHPPAHPQLRPLPPGMRI